MNKIKKISPSKVTGGGGFSFENNTAAYFLSCLIAKTPPFDPKFGIIKKIDFQTRVDGWLLDDVLLHLDLNGEIRRCALSIRSNEQFTLAGKVPSDFLYAAWAQYLADQNELFKEDKDLLGIVTAPLSSKLSAALNNLLLDASHQKDKLFSHYSKKGHVSKLALNLLNGFICPEDLAKKHSVAEGHTFKILNCMVYDSFDFENQNSQKIKEAVNNCRNVLESQNISEAKLMWSKLIEIADSGRPRSGSFDYQTLLKELRQDFKLRDCRDHISDWSLLNKISSDELKILRDDIGGQIRIERSELIQNIEDTFEKTNIILLLGPSGCGKTVLARQWLDKKRKLGKGIWLDAKIFDKGNLIEVERALGLANHIQELFQYVPDKCSYLVIDAIDRHFSDNVLKNIAIFIKDLEQTNKNTQWKLIITSQDQDWLQVHRGYSLSSIPLTHIGVGELNDREIEPVLKEYPFLKDLRFRKELKPLLYKPKILDLLITRQKISGNINVNKWIGETDLINWFWESEVRQGSNASQRADLLMRLGEKQADDLENEISITTFSGNGPLDELKKENICRIEEERVSFVHDSFADWSRQRVILSNAKNLKAYLEQRVNLPTWHKAIRLYGLYLIEKNESADRWRDTFNEVASDKTKFNIVQDLLLDSLIVAVDSHRILNILWPVLKDNNGVLFKRLLHRFLHIATLPNPNIIRFIESHNVNLLTEAATYNRIIYWPYWIPVLRFLIEQSDDVKKIAPDIFSEIAMMWLQQTPQNWPYRKEISNTILDIAENIFDIKKTNRGYLRIKDGIDKISYKAALAAIKESPDRVKEFALKACSRHSTSPIVIEIKAIKGMIYSPGDYGKVREPWTDGPKSEVDKVFQEICLTSDAIHPVIESNPNLAKEILLALLIEHPTPEKTSYDTRDLIHDHLEVTDDHEYYPPFYTKGPFLYFLNQSPIEGLKLIISIVNFAAERWCDRFKLNNREAPYVEFGEPNKASYKWYGDSAVFYWYRGQQHCPDLIVSALMALEKWIYGLLDENKDVNPYINLIIENSKTLAFAGLLSAIGSKRPKLFLNELKCLLTAPEFYHWEFQNAVLDSTSTSMISWGYQDQISRKLALEWNSLEHRHQLHLYAKNFMLNFENMNQFFKDVLIEWRKRLTKFAKGSQPVLEDLIFKYNKNNYRIIEIESKKAWDLKLPVKVKRENEKALKQVSESQLLMGIPLRCRSILQEQKVLNDEQCEEYWLTLNRVKSFKAEKDLEGVVVKEDSLCAGAAILIKLNSNWLDKYPKRKKWCIDIITKTILNPPLEKDDFGIEHSATDWKWHNFCAEVMPIIWSDNLKSKQFRTAIVYLALHKQRKTIEGLFASSGEVREKLGEEFKKLQHFIIKVSIARWKERPTYSQNRKKSNSKNLIKNDMDNFISGKINSRIPALRNVVSKTTPQKSAPTLEKKRYRQSFDLDIGLVLSAYKWQISLTNAKDNKEREEWINVWKEILFVLIETFGKEEDGKISGTPYEQDRLILHRIAKFVIEMENSEGFWKPVLDIGEAGHYWVQDFLQSFFIFGLTEEPPSVRFITRWKQMIDYALSDAKWNPQDKKYRHDLKDLWLNLMGLELLYQNRWSQEHIETVLSMESYFKKWVDIFLSDGKCMAYFVIFLKKPASKAILFHALEWISSTLAVADEYIWRHYDVEEHLAQLLNYTWSNFENKLKEDKKTFDAFGQILTILVERGNRLALALQDSMGLLVRN